jgi:hypothetical protein
MTELLSMRSHRGLLAVLLSLLLLAAQQEGFRHALSHWSSSFASDQKSSLRSAVDTPCDECTLLASGAHAAVSHAHLLPVASVAWQSPNALWRSFAQGAPAYYQAQAPPGLL